MRRETFPTTSLKTSVPAEMGKPCQFYHKMNSKADLFDFNVLLE